MKLSESDRLGLAVGVLLALCCVLILTILWVTRPGVCW